MAEGHIFVSYPHNHAPKVETIVVYMNEVLDNRTWFDRKMGVGKFESQIRKNIISAKGMIVFLTQDSVGPTSSGWLEREIEIAIDSKIETILPCIIGDFVLPDSLKRKIRDYHTVWSDDFEKLTGREDFRALISNFRGVLDGSLEPNLAGSFYQDEPKNWFSGNPAVSNIALALTTAVLETRSANIVIDLADALQEKLERNLREKTASEMEAEPRALNLKTVSDRLSEIGAEKVTVLDANGETLQDIVRFKNRNWTSLLLHHVWNEIQVLREILLDWMNELLGNKYSAIIGDEIARSLGIFAHRNFTTIRYRFLDQWLFDDIEDLANPKFNSAEIILTAATETPKNTEALKELFAQLIYGTFFTRLIAAKLALGQVGLRRPEIAVFVLRKLGRMTFENQKMCVQVLSSPAIYAAKIEDETSERNTWFEVIQQDDPRPRESDVPPSASDSSEEGNLTSTPDFSSRELGSFENLEKEKKEPDKTDHAVKNHARSIPAARFLAALADWADEKISDPRELVTRHVPLYWLLVAFERMPYQTRSMKSNRLTLEDLVKEIKAREGEIFDSIIRGLVRATLARKVSQARYPARKHLQYALRSFARERDNIRKKNPALEMSEGGNDPFLIFVKALYAAVASKEKAHPELVIERSGQFLSEADIEFIRSE